DDECRQPGVDDQGQREDDRGDQGGQAEEPEETGNAEHAESYAGTFALLGDLCLGEADLRADELRDLLGELVDQRSESLTLWRSVLSSHVSDLCRVGAD